MAANKTFKKSGFRQGLMEISDTQKEALGCLRITQTGEKYRYAKAGATALAAGKMHVCPDIGAVAQDQPFLSAVTIGTKVITLTLNSATNFNEDYFKDGFLQINDDTGEGLQYQIDSSTEVTAGTTVTVTLADPILVATTTATTWTLAHSPWQSTVISTGGTYTDLPVGIPRRAVTANYYYWSQTGGQALCLTEGASVIGSKVTFGASVNGAMDVTATAFSRPIFGIMWGYATTDTEYAPVWLNID